MAVPSPTPQPTQTSALTPPQTVVADRGVATATHGTLPPGNPNINPGADTTPGQIDPTDPQYQAFLANMQQQASAQGLGDLNDLLKQFGLGDTTTKPVDPTIQAAERIYFEIWGVKPPHGYVKAAVEGGGMNPFEFAFHELSKPGADKTQFWRDKEASYAAVAAQVFARR